MSTFHFLHGERALQFAILERNQSKACGGGITERDLSQIFKVALSTTLFENEKTREKYFLQTGKFLTMTHQSSG